MANTIKHFKGNGSQKKFNFGMDYLQKNFIKLSVSFVDKVYGVDYTITDQEIDILVPPAMDADVFIRRETSSKPLVTWHDATVLTALDMTLTEIQVLHLQEEVSDAVKTDAKENAQIATEQAQIATKEADRAKKEAGRSFESAETSANRTVEASRSLLEGYEKSCVDAKDTIVPLVPEIQKGVSDANEALVDARQAMTDVRSLGGVPVGTVAMFLTSTIPSGFLCLSGDSRVSTFNPQLYPDLYKALGNVNTLPDCTNKFPQGAGDKIKGSAVRTWRLPAFETNTTGNIDTYLAPDAFGVYWGIKAFGGIVSDGVAQVDALVKQVTSIQTQVTSIQTQVTSIQTQVTSIQTQVQTQNALVTWVRFDATGKILASRNIQSVVKNSTGVFTINFLKPLPEYVITGSSNKVSTPDPYLSGITPHPTLCTSTSAIISTHDYNSTQDCFVTHVLFTC